MPLVQISMLPGRTPEQKRTLVKEVTRAVVHAVGAPPTSVRVIINEVPLDHWAVAGVTKLEEREATRKARV